MQGRAVIALGMLLVWCQCALALDPRLDVSQYAHTGWKVRDGFEKGIVTSIEQTPDGYLWLGTEFGLVRFDGVRPQAWHAPPGEPLPDTFIRRLIVTKDGRLWIGTDKGLASWKEGKITVYAELAGFDIAALLEDREGTLWASGWDQGVTQKLCSIRPDGTHCDAGDATFDRVHALYQDTKGNLWVGAKSGLWRLKPGTSERYPTPDNVVSVLEGEDGALLISTPSGIKQLVDGKIGEYALASHRPEVNFTTLFKDRDGGLWIGTAQRGVLHVHQGGTDGFSVSDGMSSDFVSALFEDREGNVWVATPDGLDRFREFTVPTMSAKQGLSSNLVISVLAAKDGSIWLGTIDGLNRWKDGGITIYRTHARGTRGRLAGVAREIVDDRLPDGPFLSLFEDIGGRIWVSTRGGIAYFENGRFVPVPGVIAGRNIFSMAGDSAGNLWISGDRGLLHLRPDGTVESISWSTLGREAPALALAPDLARGGLWLGFHKGGVAYWKDDRVRSSFTTADGLGDGLVEGLRLDPDGTLWAATGGGLSRLNGDKIATLTSKNGLPCNRVHWLLEGDDRALWLGTECGVVSISRSELDGWIADPGRTIRVTLFDSSDGVRSHPITAQYSPQAAKSMDGRLWFLSGDGVSVIDPRHLPVNKLPPPVQVEQVIADRKAYGASSHLALPPLVRDLQIDYTALSFVAPERVLFRYRLEGRDRDWQDAGNRRQAFYTDLDPGNYRFRVIACNNSGVWNEQGASLNFSIAPAYWQTRWFVALCVVALIGLLSALYQLRLRQLARQFNRTLDARVGERTRIARELHDTLLQSFHGLLLRFQTASELLSTRPAEAKQTLDGAIDQAAQAITEGRDAVQGLRASVVESNDLAVAIRTFGEELAAEPTGDGSIVLQVVVEGTSRALHPIQRDEIYRVACEALRNAFRHAKASQIEVELRYDDRQLRLRVRDDGKGIDPKFLGEEGRAGHYGLHGMRERAKLMGAKFTVWSAPDSGTEVELSVPAARAYATTTSTWRSWFTGKRFGESVQSES